MNIAEDAGANFAQGYNCSQSVAAAFAAEFGVDRETVLRLAAAFGGGMARAGETCGAVSGALMVIGLRYGQVTADDRLAKERTYAAAQQFMARFRERHGALKCRELLGCDIGTPEGQAAIKELQLSQKVCAKAVYDAAEIVAEIVKQIRSLD